VGREVDSAALLDVNRILRLAGSPAGSQRTILEDGELIQVLSVGDIVRRSLSLAGTENIVTAVLQNVHGAGSTSLTSSFNPYVPANRNAPYPANVREGLDFWLLGASMINAGGTASNFTEGQLSVSLPLAAQAISADDSGAAIVAAAQIVPVAHWDGFLATALAPGLTEQGEFSVPVRMRIRRGSTVRLDTVAGNAVTPRCVMWCSLTPSALGQDVFA